MVYTTCPMSIKEATGYALQRTLNGEVKYFGDVHGIRLFPHAQAEELVRTLGSLLPLTGPSREWMERDGARANTKKPVSYRPSEAMYCPAGRHDRGYPTEARY